MSTRGIWFHSEGLGRLTRKWSNVSQLRANLRIQAVLGMRYVSSGDSSRWKCRQRRQGPSLALNEIVVNVIKASVAGHIMELGGAHLWPLFYTVSSPNDFDLRWTSLCASMSHAVNKIMVRTWITCLCHLRQRRRRHGRAPCL